MPLGFLPTADTVGAVAVSSDEQKIVNYLAGLMKEAHEGDVPDYHVSLDVNISFKRTPAAAATAVIANHPNDPNAIHVNITEEDIRNQYPLDYAALTTRLENRYIDLRPTRSITISARKLVTHVQFKRTRLLDLANPAGLKKDYYSPNIVK